MRNEEFEIVRDLISGRGPQAPEPQYGGQAATPASFREIDGLELARQYVAHRKFRESEALAQQIATGKAVPDGAPTGVLRGERRSDFTVHPASERATSGGWFSNWTRLVWRR
jgi:hypothetical protein